MEKKLDEKFIVKNEKSKEEYIEKINLFLNSHKGYKCYETDSIKNNLLINTDKKFVDKYGCVLLNEHFYVKGSLNTSTYNFFIVYSKLYDSIKVIIFSRYHNWWNNNREKYHFIDEMVSENGTISLQVYRRLYKLIVTDVVDHSFLLRDMKNLRDEIIKKKDYKYFFNRLTNTCSILKDVKVDIKQGIISGRFSQISLQGLYITKPTFNYTFKHSFKEFQKKYLDEKIISSNDFTNQIMPLFHEAVQDSLEKINKRNATVLASIDSF